MILQGDRVLHLRFKVRRYTPMGCQSIVSSRKSVILNFITIIQSRWTSRTMTNHDLVAHAQALLDANRYLTRATADPEGRSWTSPVYFAAA